METRVRSGEMEDPVSGAIERQSTRFPSVLFLGCSIGAMAGSAMLKLIWGKDDWALWVGQWAAPFLILGTYNKMVKQHGSDWMSKNERRMA